MADQQPNGGGNGADDNAQPQVSIFAQYVKDLSVENPSAPEVYSWQVQPSLDVGEHVARHEVRVCVDHETIWHWKPPRLTSVAWRRERRSVPTSGTG